MKIEWLIGAHKEQQRDPKREEMRRKEISYLLPLRSFYVKKLCFVAKKRRDNSG